jgi:hypothetical protein
MVFSSTAAAFLHLNEHIHDDTHAHHHFTELHHQDDLEDQNDADHSHHSNLHIVGDVIEHNPLLFCVSDYSLGEESYSRLFFRTYTPPIPPPNA